MQIDGFLFFIIVIAFGYLAVKMKLVADSAADHLSGILLNLCFPAMLLKNFINTDTEQLLHSGLTAAIVSLVFSLLPFFVCLFVFRRAESEKKLLFRYILSVGNTSFVCIPLMSLFLNSEQMMIVIVHGAVMDILIWGVHHQLFLGSNSSNWKEIMKKIFSSPCLLAVLLGVILCIANVKLPSFLSYTIDALAATVSPLALLFIGMLICRYGLFGWIKCRDAIFNSLWRVIVYPCLVFAILYWFLPLQSALILAIVFGSPAPISAVLWCKEYGRDTRLVVNCLIPSTILYFLVMGTLLLILTHCCVL